MFEDL
jgi:hypothetical protein